MELEDASVEEDVEDRTIQGFQKCCVVFEYMLDTSQKIFLSGEDIMICMFNIHQCHISICLNAPYAVKVISNFYFDKP